MNRQLKWGLLALSGSLLLLTSVVRAEQGAFLYKVKRYQSMRRMQKSSAVMA